MKWWERAGGDIADVGRAARPREHWLFQEWRDDEDGWPIVELVKGRQARFRLTVACLRARREWSDTCFWMDRFVEPAVLRDRRWTWWLGTKWHRGGQNH